MKKCSSCLLDLPVDCFSRNARKVDGLQTKCKDCTKAYYHNYYRTTPKEKERLYGKNKERRTALRAEIHNRKDVPCADCLQLYPYYVMDFDHQSDKKFHIATAVSRGASLVEILREIEKCEVVCANCHRVRTHQDKDLAVIEEF